MALSGVITVSTAGTAVQGDDVGAGTFLIEADAANTGYIYIGDDSVGTSTGFQLAAGDTVPLVVGSFDSLWFDGTTNGNKARYIKVGGEHVGYNPPAI